MSGSSGRKRAHGRADTPEAKGRQDPSGAKDRQDPSGAKGRPEAPGAEAARGTAAGLGGAADRGVPFCPLDTDVRAVVLLDSEERIVYVNPPAREALARMGVEDPRTLWELPAQLQPAIEANRPASGDLPETRGLAEGLWGVYLPVREMDPDWLRGMVEAEQMAAVGQLAATVAQEIGGPNTSIQVAVDHLLDRLETRLADSDAGAQLTDHQKTKQTLEQVLSQTERITRLTRQLINLADPGSTRLESVDLAEIAESACDLLEGSFHDRGIQCHWELGETSVWALADRNHLLQALVNVLFNARTALQGWSGPREIRIRSEVAAQRVYLHVEDSGPGIPQEEHSRIFLPFVSTTGGTGMGLFLTRQLLVEQGGGIRVKSPNDMGGATFTVYLEREPESEGSAGAETVQGTSRAEEAERPLVGGTSRAGQESGSSATPGVIGEPKAAAKPARPTKDETEQDEND